MREIEVALKSHATRLHHLGGTTAARSALADANAKRPAAVFTDVFAELLKTSHPGLRRMTREALHLIDATSIRLSDLSRAWANYEAHGAAIKVHVD